MRSTFKTRSTAVVLTHDDETVTLTLHAIPASYAAYIEAAMPEPGESQVVDGVAVFVPGPKAKEWTDLRWYLMLARAMDGTGELEAARNGDSPAAWEQYARAVRGELQAAGFTDEDTNAMAVAMNRLRYGGMLKDAPEGEPGNA